MFTSLCALQVCLCVYLLVCLFVFLPKCSPVSVSSSLFFVCLFGCYSAPDIVFGKCLYCFCKFDFVTQSSFSSIITDRVLFHFFIGPLGGEFDVFKRHVLSLLGCCMSNPFKVSIDYIVLFVLQKLAFCFCLS